MRYAALFTLALAALLTACSEGASRPVFADAGIPWQELPDFGAWPDTGAGPQLDGLAPDGLAPADAGTGAPQEQSPPGTASCKPGLSSEGSRWVKQNGGAQSIYDRPNTAGAGAVIQGSVPEGGKMDFFPGASKDGWACVLHGGTYGFVDASALTTSPPAGGFPCKPGLAQDGSRWGKLGVGALNLRDEPHVGGAILLSIPEGVGYPVAYYPDGDDAGWACVGFAGKVGYASATYLATAPPSGADPGGGYDSGTGKCVSDVNVGCWWLTKPCDWRTTKADCLAAHWWSGDQCCTWMN